MEHSALYSWFQLTLGFFGVVGVFLLSFTGIALVFMRKKKSAKEVKIEIKSLNNLYSAQKDKVLHEILDEEGLEKYLEEKKKKAKAEKALLKDKKNPPVITPKRVFVLDFVGDISASCLPSFREQVTSILQVGLVSDEVVVRLESPGGLVHAYGLAASQLARIRDKGIPLTICVDKVAASGGYMMACLAHKIIAAPFAILGSIGVVANVPNFNRLLQEHNVDYFEMTAGEYKRTVSMLGQVTPQGVAKFKEQLEETHDLFKDHIKKYRPVVNIDQVATGEYWLAVKALEYQLVDELKTSDDYLLTLSETCRLYHIFSPKKESLREKFLGAANMFLTAAHHKKMETHYPVLM